MTTPRTKAENAAFVIDSIRALGIMPHPQSRLMRMHDVLTKTEYIQAEDPLVQTALEAERDMQQLGFVFSQPNPCRDRDDFRALVNHVLDDSVLPQDDVSQSHGRDFQFELFIAAVCQSAGLTPVNYTEPDVTCTVNGVTTCIAAKRLKSVTALKKRVKKAAQQIGNTQMPGIIAIDTCAALNPDNKRITTPMPEKQFGQLYKQAMTQFLHEWHRKIYDWVAGKPVRGVVFHDHQVRLALGGGWELSSMTFWLSTAFDDQQATCEFESFKDQYVKGLPNLEHV